MGSFRRPVLSAASHGSVGSGSAGLAASMGRAGAHSVGLLTPSASAGLSDGTAYASEIDPDMTAIQSAAGAGMAAGSMGDGEQVRPGSAQEQSRRGLGAAQQGSAPRLPSPPPRHSSFRGSSTSNAGTQVRNRSQSIQVGASGAWSGTGGTAGTVASSPAGATGSQARQGQASGQTRAGDPSQDHRRERSAGGTLDAQSPAGGAGPGRARPRASTDTPQGLGIVRPFPASGRSSANARRLPAQSPPVLAGTVAAGNSVQARRATAALVPAMGGA